MIKKIVELANLPPSQNKWERTNRYVKQKMMFAYRDSILLMIGEGPWKKVYLKKKCPKIIRDKVIEDLRKDWPAKRTVYVEVNTRRPRRFDGDRRVGGMVSIWDALQWSGWCVTDHVRWLRRVIRPESIGDPKMMLEIWVPEDKAEEDNLHQQYEGQWI